MGRGLFLRFKRRFSVFFYGLRFVSGALNQPPPPLAKAGACGMLSSSNTTGDLITKSFLLLLIERCVV